MKRKLDLKMRLKLTELLCDIKLRHPLINSGGCGVFALSLGDRLNELGYNVEYRVMISKRNSYELELANVAISNNSINGIYQTNWEHIMIKVGKHYIDVSGIYDEVTKFMVTDKISEEFLREWLSIKQMWNRLFDRKQMKGINMRLNNLLK
jgi:hypothetical protein